MKNMAFQELESKGVNFFNKLSFLETGVYTLNQLDKLLKKELEIKLLGKFAGYNPNEIVIKYHSEYPFYYTINSKKYTLTKVAEMFEEEWISAIAKEDNSFGKVIPMLDYFSNLNIERKKRKINLFKFKKVENKESLLKKINLSPDLVQDIKCLSKQVKNGDYLSLFLKNGFVYLYEYDKRDANPLFEETKVTAPNVWDEITQISMPVNWVKNLKEGCYISIFRELKESCDYYYAKLTAKCKPPVIIPILSYLLSDSEKNRRKYNRVIMDDSW